MPTPAKKSAKPASGTAPKTGPAPTAQRIVVGIKVHFVLNTRDGMRRVIFGLQKDTQGTAISWTINFQLFERAKKTDDFGDALVDVDVEVDTQLNQKAEAASQGLSASQSAHAVGPAADDAKAANEGDIDQSDANDTIQATLSK